MKCQLCGFEFSAEARRCHTSCLLGAPCTLVCCPNCGYQMIDESRSRAAGLLQRAWAALKERTLLGREPK